MRFPQQAVFAVSLLCSAAANASVGDEVMGGAVAGGLVGAVVGATSAGIIAAALPEKDRLIGSAASTVWAASLLSGVVLGGLAASPHDEDAAAGAAGVVGGAFGVAGPVALMAWGLAGIPNTNSGWQPIAFAGAAVLLFWPVTIALVGSLAIGVYAGVLAHQTLEQHSALTPEMTAGTPPQVADGG